MVGGKELHPADVLGTFPWFLMSVLTDSEEPTTSCFNLATRKPLAMVLVPPAPPPLLGGVCILVSLCTHSRLCNAMVATVSTVLPQVQKGRARCHHEWQEPVGVHVRPRSYDT